LTQKEEAIQTRLLSHEAKAVVLLWLAELPLPVLLTLAEQPPGLAVPYSS
jgi:hypothetical protein